MVVPPAGARDNAAGSAPMSIPILVLAVVFVLIAVRRLVRRRLPIWAVMSGGALTVLLTGEIAPARALAAINVDVMLFLFGAFVVGQALETSGYLFHLSYKLFRRARSADMLLLLVLFGAALASAFLMNDTLAIIGTPLVLLLRLCWQNSSTPSALTSASFASRQAMAASRAASLPPCMGS